MAVVWWRGTILDRIPLQLGKNGWREREREFMNAPLCARFISAPTASAKSPVTPIVLEKHLKEADMGFQRV